MPLSQGFRTRSPGPRGLRDPGERRRTAAQAGGRRGTAPAIAAHEIESGVELEKESECAVYRSGEMHGGAAIVSRWFFDQVLIVGIRNINWLILIELFTTLELFNYNNFKLR